MQVNALPMRARPRPKCHSSAKGNSWRGLIAKAVSQQPRDKRLSILKGDRSDQRILSSEGRSKKERDENRLHPDAVFTHFISFSPPCEADNMPPPNYRKGN